jgi:hypothetical protein
LSIETDDFRTLREGLAMLAERPGPASSLDVPAARASGERALRIRRATKAGVGVAAVAVVMAGALAAALLPPATHGIVTTPGSPATSFPLTSVPLTEHGDPVSIRVVLGDVPSGYAMTEDEGSGDTDFVQYQGYSAGVGTNTISLRVTTQGDSSLGEGAR